MTFDPRNFGLTNYASAVSSRTTFTQSSGVLTVISNGIPAPALYDSTGVQEQDYKINIVYRAGTNTQSPQPVLTDNIGIFANGVPFRSINPTSRLPGLTAVAPRNFKFNTVQLGSYFDEDLAGARVDDGVYNYRSGKFLTSAWNISQLLGASEYFRTTSYNGDQLRHPNGHSKILGFAFDGYPIYGPYGYVFPTDASLGIKQIKSGFIPLPSDSHRPSGWKYTDSVILTNSQSLDLVPGTFVDDFAYRRSAGDLDEFNGRYCITPDFPNGTYAYFLTFEDDQLAVPAYPYIVGHSTKQQRNFVELNPVVPDVLSSLWNIGTGSRLSVLIERELVNLQLPIANYPGVEVELISGSIPTGTRFEGTNIVGTVFEVSYNTTFTAVIRAKYNDIFDDRTVEIVVTGPDDPQWITPEGLLKVGRNNTLFILDNEIINYQLEASDTDLPAGDVLTYFIAEGDGLLPPGISLSDDGRLTGIVEPLLSLDKNYEYGGYDSSPYSGLPIDYSVRSANGFSSFYYDTQDYDYNDGTLQPKKLNRYYPFTVTVTDGDTFVRRTFNIYVVGDDFLTADNTIMQAATGVFSADNTNVRTPTWITPSDLGFRRANNYITLYLDTIDNPTLNGVMTYTLESTNKDGSPSILPPGLSLDSQIGEIVGYVPYQPAITKEYMFTVKATRITNDLGVVEIFANYYEDTLLGNTSFKVFKLDRTGDIDGVNDLLELIGRNILLGDRTYRVINVDGRNPEFDIIFLDQTLAPAISLVLSRAASIGDDYLFVNRLGVREKEKYTNRSLRFSGNEVYTIENITPYIEYDIRQRVPENTDILPANAPQDIQLNRNYFVGDYVIYSAETGGNGFIYQCTAAHTVVPQLDVNGDIVFDANDNIQVNFESTKWTQVAETLSELSLQDRINATKQALEIEYGHTAFVNVIASNHWTIKIPSTARSRAIGNIRQFFLEPDDSTSKIEITVLKDTEDYIQLSTNLLRNISSGNNIGIALFARDFFSERLIVAERDEVDIPSSNKTFTVRIIGEIDSNIKWLSDPDLGVINANFTSTLKIEAETTVPDSRMVYSIVHGRLPNGMHLRYDGEIVGAPKQFADSNGLGLTTFDNKKVTWDGLNPGDTTFDRVYTFTAEARDRFGFTAITQEFFVKVEDLDETQYTDIFVRPMLKPEVREQFSNFISNPGIFSPDKIYRLGDPNFGLQGNLDMLVYAGIEAKDISEFVAAAAKNHKRKQYGLGEFKSAIANMPNSATPIYEVVYIEVIDYAQSAKGKTASKFRIDTKNKITTDSMSYAAVDDETRTGLGYDSLPVYGRNGFVRFLFTESQSLIIETREGDVALNTDNNDFTVILGDNSEATVVLQVSDSEPTRIRPATANTIKADSNAIKISQSGDNVRYRASIEHMRDNIEAVGKRERNYLPIWMRTPQQGLQELDYVTAIPICYCKPGESVNILRNIRNSGFDPKIINYDIDRYIIKRTENSLDEQFILFANYQFNV